MILELKDGNGRRDTHLERWGCFSELPLAPPPPAIHLLTRKLQRKKCFLMLNVVVSHVLRPATRSLVPCRALSALMSPTSSKIQTCVAMKCSRDVRDIRAVRTLSCITRAVALIVGNVDSRNLGKEAMQLFFR